MEEVYTYDRIVNIKIDQFLEFLKTEGKELNNELILHIIKFLLGCNLNIKSYKKLNFSYINDKTLMLLFKKDDFSICKLEFYLDNIDSINWECNIKDRLYATGRSKYDVDLGIPEEIETFIQKLDL